MLKMFHICSMMKWAHLPWPGAITDQHAEWFDFCMYVWAEQGQEDKRRREEEERKAKRHR